MSALLFYIQALLILAAAAVFASYFLSRLLAPVDDGASAADLPGGDQCARRAEHHHDKHVLDAQLALGEQGGEGFEGGVVGSFHGSKF
jgi:hypothetical protein